MPKMPIYPAYSTLPCHNSMGNHPKIAVFIESLAHNCHENPLLAMTGFAGVVGLHNLSI